MARIGMPSEGNRAKRQRSGDVLRLTGEMGHMTWHVSQDDEDPQDNWDREEDNAPPIDGGPQRIGGRR